MSLTHQLRAVLAAPLLLTVFAATLLAGTGSAQAAGPSKCTGWQNVGYFSSVQSRTCLTANYGSPRRIDNRVELRNSSGSVKRVTGILRLSMSGYGMYTQGVNVSIPANRTVSVTDYLWSRSASATPTADNSLTSYRGSLSQRLTWRY